MRVSIPILLAALVVAALAVVTGPAAASTGASSLVLTTRGPVMLGDPMPRCPFGTATATVTVAGTGEQARSTACAKRVASCGTGCARYRVVYDIPLAGGLIRTVDTQRQVSSADRRSIGVTLTGTVFHAGGSYAALEGAPVNGGGALSVQADGSLAADLAVAITPTS